jgi:hydrogenase maturation factor
MSAGPNGAGAVPPDEGASHEELARAALTLARRFATGATMWCVSPQWPPHGRHVAVEFVHPVIVGKRALPSVHLDGPDPASALRLLARPGDILLAVSTADDTVTADLLRRADAWGLTRLWLGAGARPPAGIAEHVVWAEGADAAMAARSGEVVILYHLLWELTHVVFEHPGLITVPPARDAPLTAGGVCITCSDQGQVAEVRAIRPDGLAEVLVGGQPQMVDVSLVDPVAPDDLVLVHAGIAIASIGTDRP